MRVMQRGMPEQIREVQRRRRVTYIAYAASFLVTAILGIGLERFFGSGKATAFVAFTWLFGGCGLMVFTLKYWRCPNCKHHFDRASEGRFCVECQTNYER